MVQLGGLEPPTSWSTAKRSNQLSYSCTRRKKRAQPHKPKGRDHQGKGPGQVRAKARARPTGARASGGKSGGLEDLAEALFHRLNGIDRDLLCHRAQLFGLGRDRLVSLACMR